MSSSLFIPSITATGTFGQALETFTVPPANGGGGGGGGLANRGANYFFGFLITFVVLLLVFVGCGIGSRRRYMARREAMFVDNMEPWAVPGGMGGVGGIHSSANVEYKPPIIYEPSYEFLSSGDNKWSDFRPLAAVVIMGAPPDASSSGLSGTENQQNNAEVDASDFGLRLSGESPHAQRLSQSQVPAVNSADHMPNHETRLPGAHNPHRPLLLSVVSPLGGLRPHSDKPNTGVNRPPFIGNDVPEALQVSIVIVMPSPTLHTSRPRVHVNKASSPRTDEKQSVEMIEIKEEPPVHLEMRGDALHVESSEAPPQNEPLPEYQIGVTTIPWYLEMGSNPPHALGSPRPPP